MTGRVRAVLRALATWPPIALPGYLFATLCAFLWGCLLLGHFQRRGLPGGSRMHFFSGLPRWAFGRGGTTVGAIFLTHDATADEVLEHEAVHKRQWRRYGLALVPLYIAAGPDGLTNRFEIEAGLEKGGYLPRNGSRPDRAAGRAVKKLPRS